MIEPLRDRTAAGVAWLRAAHQLLDDPPRILDDPAVVAFLGPRVIQQMRDDPSAALTQGARMLRAHVVLRSRFAEDRLDLAVQRGVEQYVMLGAGYDTFSVRQPEWARGITVIEVDRAPIQQEKRARFAKAGLTVPANVRFVPIDFHAESLEDAFERHGLSLEKPTFFSWLGVTMYLTEPAIDAVLRLVAETKGNEIVFTFAPRVAATDTGPVPGGTSTLPQMAASVGEPWLTYFEADELEEKLRRTGFTQVDFLTPDRAARYFADRTDGLEASRRVSIVDARV
jgi:methyltransferase (TIGR00027 family)